MKQATFRHPSIASSTALPQTNLGGLELQLLTLTKISNSPATLHVKSGICWWKTFYIVSSLLGLIQYPVCMYVCIGLDVTYPGSFLWRKESGNIRGSEPFTSAMSWFMWFTVRLHLKLFCKSTCPSFQTVVEKDWKKQHKVFEEEDKLYTRLIM